VELLEHAIRQVETVFANHLILLVKNVIIVSKIMRLSCHLLYSFDCFFFKIFHYV